MTAAVWPRVVLLDRDGVLNVNRREHVTRPGHWQWLSGAVQACARLAARGIALAVVTNQAVLARGLLSEAGLAEIHRVMLRDLAVAGVPAPLILFCPHDRDHGCGCRKPRSGLITTALRRLGAAAGDAVLVGDHTSDIMAAQSARCWSLHVRSGRGDPPPGPVLRYLGSVPDLTQGVDLLLGVGTSPTGRPGREKRS